MSRRETLFTAQITMVDGSVVTGSVTTSDYTEFLFRNTSSDLDYYMSIEKMSGHWTRKFGPTIEYPESQITELGEQIDQFLSNRF